MEKTAMKTSRPQSAQAAAAGESGDKTTGKAPSDPLVVVPVAALADNYVWVMQCHGQAVVVDPGEAAPVLTYLSRHHLQLAAILVTHHHADHQGGIAELQAAMPVPVFGPAIESITGLTSMTGSHPQATEGPGHAGFTLPRPLFGGESLILPGIEQPCAVLAVPGHTRGHLAFVVGDHLFCGDTLFAAGCGRLFEGSPAQMAASLATLAALPAETRVCCAHEYTLANLRFAAAVEPDNPAIVDRVAKVTALRAAGQPSLPSLLADELATNPFLRCTRAAVVARAQAREAALDGSDPVAVFAAIRRWKDQF